MFIFQVKYNKTESNISDYNVLCEQCGEIFNLLETINLKIVNQNNTCQCGFCIDLTPYNGSIISLISKLKPQDINNIKNTKINTFLETLHNTDKLDIYFNYYETP